MDACQNCAYKTRLCTYEVPLASSTFALLFSFPCDAKGTCPDGYAPGSLFEGADGNFYGVTAFGGTGLNAQRTTTSAQSFTVK